MDKPQSQYNMLARKVLVAAESGEHEKFSALFKGRQPEEVHEALSDLSQERFNDVLGNVNFTPLIAGAWHGHIEVLDELRNTYQVSIDQIGYIPFDGSKRNVTALCAAVRQRNLEVAQHLLDLGADINCCCPLAISCYRRDIETTRFLIQHKADVNATINDDGVTVLMVVCERYSLHLVRLLLDNDADPRLTDLDGNTALHRLALKQRMYVLKNGPIPQIVDTLVSAGAQMSENQAGQTPLAAACASGNIEVANSIMSLPEVRPEEQLTAQEKLRNKLEKEADEKRSSSDGTTEEVTTQRKTSWTEKFTNPNELRKLKWSLKKSKNKNGAGKVEDIAETGFLGTLEEIANHEESSMKSNED